VTATRPDHVDGLAVYRRTGRTASAPVVLVHGSMDRAAAFLKAVRHAPELEVTSYDRRGYGRSLEAGTAATIDELVDDLLTVVGPEPAVVVGHSLGGVIALAAAERAPDRVIAVGAFEAPMAWRPWWPAGSAGGVARRAADVEGPEAAAEQFMRRLVGDERWETLPSRTRQRRRAEGRALLADLNAMQGGHAPFDCALLTVPVVAGHGTATNERHQRAARDLAAEVPRGELVVIEGAPHSAHYTHPQPFADFVRRVTGRAG
jgi:pimeloyl-ACP methyl ester carboxylesterase